MAAKKKVMIVGAGVAGLTLGYKLSMSGLDVTILEKEAQVGGLARSFKYGDFTFDIGPHRFFTHVKEVDGFIKEILGKDFRYVQRDCSIYLHNKYYAWPLVLTELFRLPRLMILKCLADLFTIAFVDKNKKDLENYTISRFGCTLYKNFFKDFNEKITGLPCNRMHYNWLRSGLEKAMIDRKIRLSAFLDVFRPKNIFGLRNLNYIYPCGGIKLFAERLSESIRKNGGRIINNVSDIRLECDNKRIGCVWCGGEKFSVDWVVWTASIVELSKLLNVYIPRLNYVDLVIYNIQTSQPINTKKQWIYFGEKDFTFSRVSLPKNFYPGNVPAGKGSICVEIPRLRTNEEINYSTLQEGVVAGLEMSGLCYREQIEAIDHETIRCAYPLYELDYLDELDKFNREAAVIQNLKCLGRSACFSYNNMDDSILAAFKINTNILNGESHGYRHS